MGMQGRRERFDGIIHQGERRKKNFQRRKFSNGNRRKNGKELEEKLLQD
jgi:hypothetical protein